MNHLNSFVFLTESIKESTERMMHTFDKPSDGDPRIDSGPNRFVPDIKFVTANPKLNFVEKNDKGVCDELEKLLHAEVAPTRIESQLKRLSKYETDCLHCVEEILANVEEDLLIEETLKDWDEFHSGILRISGRAEELILSPRAEQNILQVNTPRTSEVLSCLCYSCPSLLETYWNGQRFTMHFWHRLTLIKDLATSRSLPI